MRKPLALVIVLAFILIGCVTTFKRIETTAGAAHIRINNGYVGVTPLAQVKVPYSEQYIVEADPVDAHSDKDTQLYPQKVYVMPPIPRYMLIDLTKPQEKDAVDVWIVRPR
jgi:uncharacterized protein YxeA